MTLDEYLVEIDRWKQPVSDQALALSGPERTELDRDGRAWLEGKLGRPLEVAPWTADKKVVPT